MLSTQPPSRTERLRQLARIKRDIEGDMQPRAQALKQLFGLPLLPSPKQCELLTCDARRFTQPILIGGAKGGGKDMPLYEIVKTPFGEKRMGDMRVSDQVLNPDGTTARVLAVHPQGMQPVYRLTFADGSSCDAGAGHLWYGWEAGKTYKAQRRFLDENHQWVSSIRGRCYTTLQVLAITERAKTRALGGTQGQTFGWFAVPVCAPQSYTRVARTPQTPLDAYVLGVLLGDGHLGHEVVSLTCADSEIAQQCEARLGHVFTRESERNHCPTYRIPATTGIFDVLRKLDLLGRRSWEKFIPEEYQYRSVDERWDLLRGLMDTDGTASKDGKSYYATTSRQLADDVKRLVESLGGMATIREHTKHFTHKEERRQGRPAYILYIKLVDPAQAFTLARKRSRCTAPQTLARRVVDVTYLGEMETQCITVDHPNGLYLTRHNIVTHNSSGGILNVIRWGNTVPENRILVCRDTYSNLSKSTLQELEKQLQLLPHWKVWPGKHEAHNLRNGAEIWWTGVGGETNRKGGVEGHKLGSTEFGHIFLEEAPDVPRSIFHELQQRLRHPAAAAQNALQLVLTANPYPGWVKEDFITHRKPGYVFIPARIRDNPHVYAEYENDLREALTEEEARAFIDGDWNALGPSDQAIPVALLDSMIHRIERPNPLDTVWGVDVSRRGQDWTTVWERSGYRFRRLDAWQGLRGTQAADRIAELYRRAEIKPRRINVDTNGLGADVTDPLVRLSAQGQLGECVVDEIFGGRAASDPLHYVNLNAELVGKLEALARARRGQIIPDPQDRISSDLTALRFTWVAGRKKVQSNEEIRLSLDRSPDDGDGLLYTLYDGREDYVGDWHGGDGEMVDEDDLEGLDEDERMEALMRMESRQKAENLMRNFYEGLGLNSGDLFEDLGGPEDLPY